MIRREDRHAPTGIQADWQHAQQHLKRGKFIVHSNPQSLEDAPQQKVMVELRRRYALTGFTRLAHNGYLQMADECGLPALAALLGAVGVVGAVGVRGLSRSQNATADDRKPEGFLAAVAPADDRLLQCGLLGSLVALPILLLSTTKGDGDRWHLAGSIVYGVSLMGVTGERDELAIHAGEMGRRCKAESARRSRHTRGRTRRAAHSTRSSAS